MKRVAALVGLLVLALGAGVTAQEAAPEATPLFAPDDLEFTLPSTLGTYELTLSEGNVADVLATTPEQRDFWRQVLLPFGKSPEEGRFAGGTAYAAPGDIAVGLFALRVAGVPAESLAEPFVAAITGRYDDLPEFTLQWLDADGRRIQALTGDDYPFPSYLYPKGEVLYFIGIASDDLLIEDVLAELP